MLSLPSDKGRKRSNASEGNMATKTAKVNAHNSIDDGGNDADNDDEIEDGELFV